MFLANPVQGQCQTFSRVRTGGIAGLYHEGLYDPVELVSVVVATTGVRTEVLARFGCLSVVQATVNVAHRCVDHARVCDTSFRRFFL